MSKRFSKIYVEITNNCNLNCSFCSKDTRLKKEMTPDEFKTVIDRIKDYTSDIYLHVKGEPLLHSNLDKILDICDNIGLNVRITTNGTLLKNRKDILLKHNIKQINISLHSENKKDNYFEDIFDTCNELSKNSVIVYRIWINKISTKIVDKIKEYYQLDSLKLEEINKKKNIKIKNNIYLDKDSEFEWPKITSKKSDIGTCLGTKSHIAILSDGNVTVCCLDSDGKIRLGNIFNESLSDILNSKLFIDISNGFKNNKVICDLCKSCTYRLRFNKKGKK